MARTVRGTAAAATTSPIRCAIYTRKSTDEGLNKDFNSLDNQREAAENYVRSQQGEGWEILADRYDDGGFTGGNMDRPALQRLLADIEAGKVDRLVVYKIDRLSRSLLDFAKLADLLETHNVSIVSVTQQLDTSTSMGRLTMNMLLSFAQFEREMVSDRTRDKMRAARRRGKWTGGFPRLGYDVAPEGGRLIVNTEEAEQVKVIFSLYVENPALVAVAQELNRRGWRRKCWKTKKGRLRDSNPWDVVNLRRMLIDPLYAGMMTLGTETFPGEHEAIVPKALFQKVLATMKENRRTGGASVRNKQGALLGGLLRCTACDAAMIHSWTRRRGRLHRYYVCGKAQKRGLSTCPTKSVSADEIETFVVGRIRAIGTDPELRQATFRPTLVQVVAQSSGLRIEVDRLTAETMRVRGEVDRAEASRASGTASHALMDGLAKGQKQLTTLESRLREARDQQASLDALRIDEGDLARALAAFSPIWDVLLAPEKERIIRLLIERIDYDGHKLSLRFRLPGIAVLASEVGEKAS